MKSLSDIIVNVLEHLSGLKRQNKNLIDDIFARTSNHIMSYECLMWVAKSY